MSIKPVDLGVMVQRMAEVDRVQQVRDQRAAVAQQQFGLEMRADLERRETEVKAAPEAARLAVNPDARRERRRGKEEAPAKGRPATGDQPPAGEEQAPARVPPAPGQRLDIKL
ncbi:MAG: hypothetical protein QME79_03265 [Bacillota bacterium]|nr:hypothetical protein [Bacillota bacterium]